MNPVRLAVRQPVTVTVGVILVLLAGLIAVQRLPIQLTPNVEDTIIAVTTRWEGASPVEIEQEVVDPQEEKLQGIANLRAMTSTSQQGSGTVRLEFQVGTSKEAALREVSDKLREVPSYPENVDEPVIEASDPQNRDYIAWIVLESPDPTFDVRTLQDLAEDRIKPVLERVAGVSQVNVLGGREREVQVRLDPVLLAGKGIPPSVLANALRGQNRDISAGALEESKADVRVRLAGQFERLEDVENTVVAQTSGGPIFVQDVAEVVEGFKEPATFVRSSGKSVLAINVQREVGSNVMTVMRGLQVELDQLNAPGGLLAVQSRKLELSGDLTLTQVYDQTIYIDDALALVQSNIWIGGALAIVVLLLFLRSVRSVGIIALAIPISIVGAMVVMVGLGRSVNVISLAGMAFAVGMVVDNAIVVLENIYRHLEMGKPPMRAAVDGGREVFGAVLAATLTTAVVFLPILLVEEEAGQLFRDISLAIVAAVTLSLVVSVTVIPASAARILKPSQASPTAKRGFFARMPDGLAALIHRLNGSVVLRVGLVAGLAVASVAGTVWLIPPTDYLPQGNRNLVFGLLISPPSYSLDQQRVLAERIEENVRPYWEAAGNEPGSDAYRQAVAGLPSVPTFDPVAGVPGPDVTPPPLTNYFIVSLGGLMFHGGICEDSSRVVDLLPLFAHATRPEVAPGVLAFAFQVPLFQLGGSTGSAIKINFAGDDLGSVAGSAQSVMLELMGRYSPYSVQPDPSNFTIPTPELRLIPDRRRQAETGLSFEDVAFAVQCLGDGALVGEFRKDGEAIDLKVISRHAAEGQGDALDRVADSPVATPAGTTVPLSSVATPRRVNTVQQINRVGRQRSITLQFTPPRGLALEDAVATVAAILDEQRAGGLIPPDVDTSFTGSASKLQAVQRALLGDGSLAGTLGSSLALALLVVYLLLCILFQSFLRPVVILLSVPLATLGGFAALRGVYLWSLVDRYLPVQQLDILTMLGFVILIGVVVNNAILIVHQTLNFMGPAEDGESLGNLTAREAITEAVRSRVRPIFMSTLTSVGGMAPLVFMPGSGSELYRGLGSVVVGGLLVSTIFTLLLVPLLLSLLLDVQAWMARRAAGRTQPSAALGGLATLCLAFGLAGFLSCSGNRARTSYGDLATRVARELAAEVPDRPGRTDLGASKIATVLEQRRDELEALGGPGRWDTASGDPGPDLFGAPTSERTLGLEEALALALEHNLGLRRKRLLRDADRDGVVAEDALFDGRVFADLEYERVDAPRQVPVLGGVTLGTPESASNRTRLEAGVRKLLSSGATVSAVSFFERYDDRSPNIQFVPDPAWRSGVALEAVQPLLRGYGDAVTSQALRNAERQAQRSEEELQADVITLAALVEQAYWSLGEAHARLRIQERLTREGEALEQVLDQRRAFDAEPAQYADALATVEARRADLIRARTLLRRASDELKALLDWEELALVEETLLVPSRGLEATPVGLDLGLALRTAMSRRPELRAALLDIEDADLAARVAASLRQPRLDLFSRVELVGEDDGLGSASEEVGQGDFLGGMLGLSFELPLGNRAAEAQARRAELEGRAGVLRYQELLRDVVREVKQALRDLRSNHELVGATQAARLAATENLRALLLEQERRSSLTPEFLRLMFDRQDRLARAQLEEVQALANFHRARAACGRAVGTGPELVPNGHVRAE